MKISILPQNKQKSIVFANLYKKVNLIGFCDLKYKLDISLNFSSCKRYPILPIRLISTNFLVYLMKEFELSFFRYKNLEIPVEFFGMIHLKDVLVVVADRWLNNKNLKCMDTIKSIFINLSLGSILTLLGNLLVIVSFGIGGEFTGIIC